MTYTNINSNGSPVLGWEQAVEGETELQRTRRRIRQGRCPGCSTKWKGRNALCAECREAGHRYCYGCERIVGLAEWRASSRRCKVCKAACDASKKGGRAAMIAAPTAHRQRTREAAQARMAEMGRLHDRGWTWEEIGRRFNVSKATAKKAYYRNRKKAREL